MLPFRRNVRLARAFLALASMCAATLVPVAPVAAAPEELAPRSYGATVTFTGHGSGHGDGLSQYGALGYAINFGWDWTQILAHYYGGTTRDAVSPTQAVRVNLTGVADATASTVVASTASLTTNADGGVGRFSTVVALEVAAVDVSGVRPHRRAAVPGDRNPSSVRPCGEWVDTASCRVRVHLACGPTWRGRRRPRRRRCASREPCRRVPTGLDQYVNTGVRSKS